MNELRQTQLNSLPKSNCATVCNSSALHDFRFSIAGEVSFPVFWTPHSPVNASSSQTGMFTRNLSWECRTRTRAEWWLVLLVDSLSEMFVSRGPNWTTSNAQMRSGYIQDISINKCPKIQNVTGIKDMHIALFR